MENPARQHLTLMPTQDRQCWEQSSKFTTVKPAGMCQHRLRYGDAVSRGHRVGKLRGGGVAEAWPRDTSPRALDRGSTERKPHYRPSQQGTRPGCVCSWPGPHSASGSCLERQVFNCVLFFNEELQCPAERRPSTAIAPALQRTEHGRRRP